MANESGIERNYNEEYVTICQKHRVPGWYIKSRMTIVNWRVICKSIMYEES